MKRQAQSQWIVLIEELISIQYLGQRTLVRKTPRAPDLNVILTPAVQLKSLRNHNMANITTLFLALCLFLHVHSRSSGVEARWADDLPAKTDDTGNQKKELLDVLHEVLEKLQNRRMTIWERRHSRLPGCNVGDFCSVKKGARFGQLCDCPRGSKCNHFSSNACDSLHQRYPANSNMCQYFLPVSGCIHYFGCWQWWATLVLESRSTTM